MGLVTKGDAWCLTDEVWEQIEPLLLVRKLHPLGCHNPRVADRDAMNAILFLLRTGCQWDALDATGICSCSPALPAFPGMDGNGRARGVLATGADRIRRHQGDDWPWLSMDGAMAKAPLSGSKKPERIRRIGANRGSSAAC